MIKVDDDEDEDDPPYDDNVDHANDIGTYGAQNNDDDSEVEIVDYKSADDNTNLVVKRRGRGRPKKIDKDNTKRTYNHASSKRKIKQTDFYAPFIKNKLGQPRKDVNSSFDTTLVEGVMKKLDKGETECSVKLGRRTTKSAHTTPKRGRPKKMDKAGGQMGSPRKSADKGKTECSPNTKRKRGRPTKSADNTFPHNNLKDDTAAAAAAGRDGNTSTQQDDLDDDTGSKSKKTVTTELQNAIDLLTNYKEKFQEFEDEYAELKKRHAAEYAKLKKRHAAEYDELKERNAAIFLGVGGAQQNN